MTPILIVSCAQATHAKSARAIPLMMFLIASPIAASSLVHPVGVVRRSLRLRPLLQHRFTDRGQALLHLRRHGVHCELEAMAIRIEEVDRLADAVVDRAEHLD